MQRSRSPSQPAPRIQMIQSGLGDSHHIVAMRKNLAKYATKILPKLKPHPLELPGQPLDRFYLNHSRLFRETRDEYLRLGGKFRPSLMSSERSLSSFGLVEPLIEYTPHEAEILYRATKKATDGERNLLAYTHLSVSSFHETNHRIFWKTLPIPTVLDSESIRRYLNLIESLVVTLDMALGDELGPDASTMGYQLGVLYDPGTKVTFRDQRERLNYYHCAFHSTYLVLEGFELPKIRAFLLKKHANLPLPLRKRAVERALKLDRLFVERTNPLWQKKHRKELVQFFESYPKSRRMLALSGDPGELLGEYVLAENVFQKIFSRAASPERTARKKK